MCRGKCSGANINRAINPAVLSIAFGVQPVFGDPEKKHVKVGWKAG
jgi:hypothetical protein